MKELAHTRLYPILCGLIPALLLWAAPVAVTAAPALSDGPVGMTCRYYALDGRMAWANAGGDWLDSEGHPQGDKPFEEVRLALTRGRQQGTWNVTDVVRTWQDESGVPGGIVLVTAAKDGGAVNFNSREHQDVAARPLLLVQWRDGPDQILSPVADASLPCSTHKSVGDRSVIQIKDGTNGVFVFPVDRSRLGQILRAELRLTADRVYHRDTAVGAYALRLPGAQARKQTGLSSSFAADKGIEAHPAVVLSERFESRGWSDKWSNFSGKSHVEVIESDPGNGFVPLDGRALKVTVAAGSVLGLNAQYSFDQLLGEEPESMYFRYYLRLGDNWDPTVDGGKLPGFSGTYNRGGWGARKSDGKNGWSARGAFLKVRGGAIKSAYRNIGSYVYSADMPQKYGSTWGWSMGRGGSLEKNRWYSIEQFVRLNTPGMSDGVLRTWVDGELAFEKMDIRYRDVADLKIEALWMNVYHGGTSPAVSDLSLYIDNLVISREYVGPLEQ